jgi:hypothetical protein
MAKKFNACCCHHILGKDLDRPVDFLVCWTAYENGIGGTALALNIARIHNIPIFNLFDEKRQEEFYEFTFQLEKKIKGK